LETTLRLRKIITIKKLSFMKKILLFLCLLLLAAGCTTQKTTTSYKESAFVYYTGNDEPSAFSGVVSYSDEQ
jgi:uncharacterized lipoprotein YajG